MSRREVEAEFLTILTQFKLDGEERIKQLDSYDYLVMHLANRASMRRCFDQYMSYLGGLDAKIHGKVWIDAGCGPGVFSLLLALLGAECVYAVDHYPACVELAGYLARLGQLESVIPTESYVEELDLPPASVDGIFCNEAISHYRNDEVFLDMASRVLKQGGWLVIKDGNNAASPIIRRRNNKLWDVFENHHGATTIYGFDKPEPSYQDLRVVAIQNRYPDLSLKEARRFAQLTFGYSKASTIAAVERFLNGDFTLRSEYSPGKCPYDPISDYYQEKLFHPFQLKRELQKRGFKVSVRSVGPSRRELKYFRALWEFFSPISVYLPRPFRVLAVKNAESQAG
jgi:2-polyprenyl-3-methyl-5-hydroxy-6-metoxy-1,4-benzoquinol methylase